MNLFVKAEK